MNPRIYYKKSPLSFIPLIILGLIIFAALAVLGLFVGFILAAAALGFMVVRLLFPPKEKKAHHLEEDNQTITLKKGEYEVIEK